MWTCETCGERHDDTFETCWKCAGGTKAEAKARIDPMKCPRCSTGLEFVGTKRLHEGSNWGILGELGEIFVHKESFDFYVCPRCGRVEMFVDGVGEEFRKEG